MNDDTNKLAAEAARWAADDGLWTTQETVEANLIRFAQAAIEKAEKVAYIQGYNDCDCELNGRAAHASETYQTCLVCGGPTGQSSRICSSKCEAAHASEPINLGQIIRARLERLAADLPAVADVLKTEAVALESLVNESRAAHAGEEPAHASEELIDNIMGDLVRETNIFPNQVQRAKELIRGRLNEKIS